MTLVNALILVAGIALIIFTLFDALVTILSLRGGGPATTFLSRKLWHGALLIHRFKSCHRFLAATGPLLMVVVVVVWYASLYLGWFLVFFSVQGNVLASPTLTEASGLEKLYFTGITLSGLGYGDFTPSSFPWTMGSTLAVFTATLLTSLGLSYIIGVVPVALEKRQMAQQINAVIDNWTAEPGQFTTPEDAQFVWQHLFSIQLNGAKFSTKYGAYPVVAYFHASDKHAAFPIAYLKAADLLFYLANHPDDRLRPSQAEIKSLKHLMSMHLDNLDPVLDISGDNPELAASRFNVPAALTSMDGDTFCWRDYAPLRRRIVAACVYDGW